MTCTVSYEDLAAWLSEDCDPARASQIAAHVDVCPSCRGHVAALRKADGLLHRLASREPQPSRASSMRIVETARNEMPFAPPQEIMTLEDVAAFLRIPPDDIAEVVEEIPAFEIAGHVRVRRTKLVEWIERRELQHRKSITESELAHALSGVMRHGILGRG